MSLLESDTSSPRLEDFVRVLADQNPWRLRGQVPESLARPIPRALGAQLCGAIHGGAAGRHHLITGPRRVGKSTVMYQTVAGLREAGVPPERLVWVRLEHPMLLGGSIERLLRRWLDSVGASQDSPAYLFLDEITFAHGWARWLKNVVLDRWPVCVVASSSTDALCEQGVVLGGQHFREHRLPPYHVDEVVRLLGDEHELPLGSNLSATLLACAQERVPDPDIETRRLLLACTGGFPELLDDVSKVVVLSDLDERLARSERLLCSEVVERALYKDLPRLERVDDPGALERLLYGMAGKIGSCLRFEELGRDLPGSNAVGLERMVKQLERALLVFTLPCYASTERESRRRAKRLFFVDGAVRNAVLGRGVGPLRDPAEMSQLMANLAAAHIKALADRTGVRLSYWGESDHHVDFVYDHPDEPVAFAVGSDSDRARRALSLFTERHPEFHGRCWHVSPLASITAPTASADAIGAVPLDSFLLAVALQADQQVSWSLAR